MDDDYEKRSGLTGHPFPVYWFSYHEPHQGKLRLNEQSAVSKTIQILTADEEGLAHDVLNLF